MCIRSVTFFISCIVVSIQGKAIPESSTPLPRWLSYLEKEVSPVFGCFTKKETGKGLQCLADAFGALLPAPLPKEIEIAGQAGQESPSKEQKLQRHENEAELEIESEEEDDKDKTKKKKKKKKKKISLKEDSISVQHWDKRKKERGGDDLPTPNILFHPGQRKRKRKTNMMIPVALGLGAVILTAIVGAVGLIAGKALAMSFLAFIMTIALSTKAVASHKRSTVVKEDISDAIADIGQQLLAETDYLPIDAIAYRSFRQR